MSNSPKTKTKTMASNSDGSVIGIVVLARHGDRQGFYQDPDTYTASSTAITPLGEQEEWQLGNLLRSLYLNASSPSFIQGIAPFTSPFNGAQVEVQADAGGEGGVIMDSCAALVQGLWQPTPIQNITLANGTTITSPLGGYQYVPIESVEPDEDVSLEGFTDCNTFDQKTEAFYNSSIFLQKQNEYSGFLSQLPPYLGGRSVALSNMWNIFDYMNVQSIHNATFAESLPPTFLAQVRDLANWHEYNVFSDTQFDGIGNIAIRTMLPGMIDAFQRIANASDPLKLSYTAIAYKPFLSLFNMTGVVADGALPAAIVDYAASVVLEVRESPSSSEPVIRFTFKNGTSDSGFSTYPLSFSGWDGTGGKDVPLSTFVTAFEPAAVNTTLQWCDVCGQTTERGCATALAASADMSVHVRHQKISPVGAGFLGAGLTVAVLGAALLALLFMGVLTLGAGRWRRRRNAGGVEGGRRALKGDEVELKSEANSVAKE